MGRYINKLPNGTILPATGKVPVLIRELGAVQVEPDEYHKDLVCVVFNPLFEAAAWCYSEEEFRVFKEPDGRHKRWLLINGVENIAV